MADNTASGSTAASGDASNPRNQARCGSPNISWPLERPNTPHAFDARLENELRARAAANIAAARPYTIPHEFMPDGKRSLSGIGIRAFVLGVVFGASSVLTVVIANSGLRIWRPCFFASVLSLFHLLEFYTTAAYNPPMATVSSFLLRNGRAYDVANAAALVECTLTSLLFPSWQATFSSPYVIALGVALILVGQVVRSAAMIQAGTNFNHQVQTTRNVGHVLVTDGIYAWLRHPSYFGYFWWGVGSQLALGNTVCLFAFTSVLWRFFSHRIRGEEKHLINFFGDAYTHYKQRVGVGIPFIR